MKSWKARLLALLTVMALLTSIAGPAMADRGDDCRRFHGERYCEVDRGDKGDHRRGDHRFRKDYYHDYYIFYPFYFPYYSYGYNDCGFDWGGPVNPYDCWD